MNPQEVEAVACLLNRGDAEKCRGGFVRASLKPAPLVLRYAAFDAAPTEAFPRAANATYR